MKRIQRILAVALCLALLMSLMGVAEEDVAPEVPAPQVEEVTETAPEPEAPAIEEPTAEPAPEVTPTAEPAPETQAPTEEPEPEVTAEPEPEITEAPQETPTPAGQLAQQLGMSEEELAALLGVMVDELRALDEAALEALYAASQQGAGSQDEAPGEGSVAPSFEIDEAGVLTACHGEHIDAVIPDGVKEIGKNAFGGQTRLRSVIIPKSVRVIDEYAFAGCEALEKVEIEVPDPEKIEEEGLVEIGLRAFFGCKKLKEIVLPETLKSVDDEAFRDCVALEKAEYPAEVLLGKEVFAGCERLKAPSAGEATQEPGAQDGAADDQSPEAPEKQDDGGWPVVLVPKAITAPGTLTVGVGEAITPDVKYTASFSGDVLSYQSDNKAVAKVNASTGKITGVKKGTANITVTSSAGSTAKIVVTVLPAPGKVTLDKTKGSLGVGMTLALTATLPKDTASQIKWQTSDKTIATVENGVVTAHKKGTATITAKTFNSKSATFTLTVQKKPTAVTIPETLKLCVNQKYEMVATLTPAAALSDISYVSGNKSVISVEGNVLTALRTGTSRITLTARNGESVLTAVCDVTVVSGPSSITISNPIETLGVGEGYKLEATLNRDEELAEFNTWTSSKPGVVKIGKKGKMTGVKAGTADVTVTAANGISRTLTVTVLAAPGKVTLNKTSGTLGVDQKLTLTATLPKNTASQITWKSDKPDIASVENGVVTAHKKGTAKITATTFNNKTATFTATVKAAPTAITMVETLGLAVNQTYKLETTLEPAAAACSKTFTSTNQSVVTVDDKGVLTALRTGSSTVRVQTHNGKTATCQVTVYTAPKTVSITNAVEQLGVGETYMLSAQLDTNAALLAHCTWKSSDTSVLKVGKAGKLTAVKAGTAKITVTTGNKEAKATVSVKVVKAPDKITMSKKEAMVARTRTLQLKATLPKGTASQITWTSSDENVATVDGNGLVTARNLGETVITAKTFNNKTAKCKVSVLTKVPVELATPTITINGAAAKKKTLEVRGMAEIAWACEGEGLTLKLQVSNENGGTLLTRTSFGNSSTQIAESQMSSGMTYTVTVTASINTQYETGESSATATFRYIDPLSEFLFVNNSTGVTITEYVGTSTTELIIPSQLGGKRVTRIGTGAFNGTNCAKITSVTWPTGVVFEEDSVTGLKKCADKNGFLVFNNILCKYYGTAATVKVPSGVIRINDGAFAGNTTVTTVKLPATVETIGARAFNKCTKLKAMSSY